MCPIPKQAGNSSFYSQYLEDYILSIVFSEVNIGAYIDIGSNSPDIHSVTKYFYLKNWSGINTEPIEEFYKESILKRPRNINLNIGIANRQGLPEFYRIYSNFRNNNYRLSTFDKNTLYQATLDGYKYKTYTIPVKSLNQVLLMHPMDNITFITVDVEGMEKEVLEGINLKIYRPIVFIIESTEPRSNTPSHQKWEKFLVKNNYEFMMFDGLNRYYLAKEYRNKFLNKFRLAYQCAVIQNENYNITPSKIYSKKLQKFLRN